MTGSIGYGCRNPSREVIAQLSQFRGWAGERAARLAGQPQLRARPRASCTISA
jgi:hypothetical protein